MVLTPQLIGMRNVLPDPPRALDVDQIERLAAAAGDDGGRPVECTGGTLPSLAMITNIRALRIKKVQMNLPLLVVVLEGQKEIHFEGRVERFSAGEMMALPAMLECDVVNIPNERTGRYRALLVSFPAALTERFKQFFPDLCARARHGMTTLQILAYPELALSLAQLAECLAAHPSASQAQVEVRTMAVLLALVERCGCHFPLLPVATSPLEQLRTLVDVAPGHPWSLDEAAERLNLSQATLRRRLAAAGLRFRGILEEARLTRSLALLQTTRQSVTEISAACGYESPSRFAARFRLRFGLTPSKFR